MAPLMMTISKPQQTLLYTPNFWFTWPVFDTVDAPKITRIVRAVYASRRRTKVDGTGSGTACLRNRLTTRTRMDIHPVKNVRAEGERLYHCAGSDAVLK